MESLPVVVLGFLLGMLHATDADHVIAVSTIVSRQRSVGGAARIGLLWGVGHTVTVFGVGAAIILFNLVIPLRLELAMEFCVALMLVLLGVITLLRVRRHVRETLASALANGLSEHSHREPVAGAHLHPHAHGDYVHAHAHAHANAQGAAHHGHADTPLSWLDKRWGGLSLYQAMRPLAIGIVHGLAGSAAVALLVLTQIREPMWAVAYLLLFGVGTTAGMMLITSVIAVPFIGSRRPPFLNLGMQVVGGALSLGLGCYMAWKVGVADGLFIGATPD